MADMNTGSQQKLMNILLEPRITEKSTLLSDEHRQFVFKVAGYSTKPDIKRAVESMFNVQVESVQVSNVKGKRKTFRQIQGRRSGWKKAYVKLKPGYDIDFAGA